MAAPMESNRSGATENNNLQVDSQKLSTESDTDRRNALLFVATGLSVFIGFGYTLFKARRRDPLYFKKMLTAELPENGIAIASKALFWGSALSVTSFCVMVFGTAKVLGVNNFPEFHAKMKTYFPNKRATGRTDFSNLTELVDYLLSEDRKAEVEKKREAKKRDAEDS